MADDPADDGGGRYRRVREIARGGMGRVVEAVDTQLARTVALKEILDAHPDARARFEREVAITARLEHPSIVPLYDAGTSASGAPFYVMRKVSGVPLTARVRAAAALDQRLTLLPNLLAVADAVTHAHSRGVIHRDLKPANVLVGDLGETVVIDWGLAKFIGDGDARTAGPAAPPDDSLRTIAGTVFGTPGFMAPEQVAGEAADARADVYALGACLYYVLAGRAPFRGCSKTEVLERTRTSRPEPLGEVVAGVPPDLVTIVDKAMAPARAARYLDAGGFSTDLRRFLGGQLVAAHHYPVRARLARWLRRRRAVVAVIALAVIALAAVGVIALRRIFDEQDRTDAALADARRRADELVVAQALSHLETNPTLAAASLAQLPAGSPRWASLGAVVADLRARGVAYGYPGVGDGGFVALAPAGDQVIAWRRGVVNVHDLSARTSKTLVEGDGVFGARWCGALIAVDRRDRDDELIDPRTGARAEPPWPGEQPALFAFADDGTAVFVDGAGRLAAVDLTAGGARARIPIAVPAPVKELALSPSGRWLAVTVDREVLVFHAARRLAFEPAGTVDGARGSATFDAASRRLAVDGGGRVVELDLAPPRAAIGRTWPRAPRGLLHYVGGELFDASADRRLYRLGADDAVGTFAGRSPRADLGERAATIVERRRIEVTSTTERYVVRPPHDVESIAGRPGGRFLVAAGPARVLVWDLDEIAARRSAVPLDGRLSFVKSDGLIAAHPSIAGLLAADSAPPAREPLHRYAIHPDRTVTDIAPGAAMPATMELAAFPDGLVLAADPVRGRAEVFEPERLHIDGIAGLTILAPLDGVALLAGTAAGAVVRVDRATGRSAGELARLAGAIDGLAANGGWIAARTVDGALWRRDPQGRETRATQQPACGAFALAVDGAVFYGCGRALIAWEAGRAPRAVASLAVAAVKPVERDLVAVRTTSGGLHVYDRAARQLREVLPASRDLVISDAGVAAAAVDGGIAIVDLATAERYDIAGAVQPLVGGLALSPDGALLAASAQGAPRGTVLHVWRLGGAPPRDWIVRATNARPPATARGPIEWSPR